VGTRELLLSTEFRAFPVREQQVLQLVAKGNTGKEIAVVLKISPKTVAFHKAGIMSRLGLHTTADLTRFSISQGLLDD